MSAARTIKLAIGSLIHVEPNIRMRMALARWFYARVPLIGIALNRALLRSYGLDVRSDGVDDAGRLTMSRLGAAHGSQ